MADKPNAGTNEGTLAQFRRLVWDRFTAWQFLVELCREIVYGEIRIVIHAGKIKDVHVDFHLRDKEN